MSRLVQPDDCPSSQIVPPPPTSPFPPVSPSLPWQLIGKLGAAHLEQDAAAVEALLAKDGEEASKKVAELEGQVVQQTV